MEKRKRRSWLAIKNMVSSINRDYGQTIEVRQGRSSRGCVLTIYGEERIFLTNTEAYDYLCNFYGELYINFEKKSIEYKPEPKTRTRISGRR